MSKKHIEDCIRHSLESYFKDLRGEEPHSMYDMILNVVEKPLLETVMLHADGNQSRAAERGLLDSARSRPILTVTESAGALDAGSIINFTQENDRVRFEISLYAAEQSMLKLNSRLLAVADSVHRRPE